MRSLTLLNVNFSPSTSTNSSLVATTLDPATDKVYTILQGDSSDGEISLEVYSNSGKQVRFFRSSKFLLEAR